MSETILVAYASKHGSTEEVAYAVAETLEAGGLEVETRPARDVDDVTAYAGVVVGGSIYMGRWNPGAIALLERQRSRLAALPVAVFGLGPRTLEAHEVESALAQLRGSIARVPEIDPFAVEVFGGVIRPASLRFPLNRLPASDARDWSAIRAWAAGLAETFGCGKSASDPRVHRTALQQTHR